MAKYVYLYTGGQLPQTPADREESLKKWTGWFGDLGGSVIDIGNQFVGSATVGTHGVSSGAHSAAGGYSVISADSLDDATAKAAGCPILDSGGSVEVYQTIEM
jgi:hypothetical protein